MKEVDRKLNAIKDKDIGDIIAKKTILPFMGVVTDAKIIQDWLGRRQAVLEEAMSLSVKECEKRIEVLTGGLCRACKEIVKCTDAPDPCEKDYESVCAITLYQFSIGDK